MKRPGDRIYLGPKVAGHYTLGTVTDPEATVLFLSTGTGEAPHNAMAAELARRDHQGAVTMLSTARHRNDFVYEHNHKQLERIWPGYRYLPLPPREPTDWIKRHIQDVIEAPDIADWTGFPLDPDRTRVFLCGNPAMVGKAEWYGDTPSFVTPNGALEIPHQQGFTLDQKATTKATFRCPCS